MRKISIAISIIVCSVLLHGCDPTIHMSIDAACQKNLDFPCGSVSLRAAKSFGPGYQIQHYFDLVSPVTLYFDSLKITHHGTKLKFDIFDENHVKINERVINVSGKKYLYIIVAQDSVKDDSFVVSLTGFMVCKSGSVYDGDLKIVLTDSSGKRTRCPGRG